MHDHIKTIILAGGLGTRLKGALGALPKPMAPIGDGPFLVYLTRFFSKQGFDDIIISCGHGADTIKTYFEDGSRLGLRIEYTFETELLGTGGALKLAEPLVDSEDFIVANGDTYFDVDLNEMYCFHKERGAVATIALAHKEDTGRYGSVVSDSHNRIVSFSEKKPEGQAGHINGGVYIFRKEVFARIPDGKVISLEREILPALIEKGLYGFPANGYFIDIGIPEDYERAKKELPGMSKVL